MVYVAPPQSPQDGPSRPGHRRSRSHTLSEDSGPGAFAPVSPSLPRRRGSKKAFFIDDDESPSPPEDDHNPLSPLALGSGNDAPPATFPTFGLASASSAPDSVPFPTDGGADSPGGPLSPRRSPRASISRTPSGGSIILSSGKPLKSSLKSSSAPHISDELRAHLRVKSEPSTPSVKSVHFREDDDLEEVKTYNRTGRPANLLLKPGEETETETEAEPAYPFPRTLPASAAVPAASSGELAFEIDGAFDKTSIVPQPNPDLYANIHLESISLPKTRPAALRGSVLVRNVAFEKQVAVRFTLDDWQTTSEVVCKHVVSLPGLPPPFPRARTIGDAAADMASTSSDAPAWDRFSFQIRLEDYADKLGDRNLYIVARYTAPSHGEWWDNNNHSNYRVGFRRAPTAPAPAPAVSQQKSFAPPATLRLTPQSGSSSPVAPEPPRPTAAITPAAAYAATFGGRLTASPRGSPAGSPRVSPSGSPKVSPKVSPNHSPNSSDNERKQRAAAAQQRPKPKPTFVNGLGVRPPFPPRPVGMSRSNSSPPVYSPSPSAGPTGTFFTAAPRETAAPATQNSGNTSPLMARLSKLNLSNYARPPPVPTSSPEEQSRRPSLSSPVAIVGGQPATMDVEVPPLAIPEVTVTGSTPPAAELAFKEEEKPAPSKPLDIPAAPSPSPVEPSSASSSPGAAPSNTSSANTSPMPGTPVVLSASDLPALVKSPESMTQKQRFPCPRPRDSNNGSGSDSSLNGTSTGTSGKHTRPTMRSADLVLNMPTPTSRGAVNSPFSPVSTPRYSLDQALLGGPPADESSSPDSTLARSRVGTNDANYAAFIRQWCFARSPSPGGSPVAGGTPMEEGPLSATMRVEVSVPRDGATGPRTSPGHSARNSPPESVTPTPFAAGREKAWLGMSVIGGERQGWEAGRA